MMIHTFINHSTVFLRKSDTFILVHVHNFIYIYTVDPASIAQLVQIAATSRVCGGYTIVYSYNWGSSKFPLIAS